MARIRGPAYALVALVASLVIPGCGGDDGGMPIDAGVDAVVGGAQPPFPKTVCPGAAGCATADGPLRVGAAVVDLTPDLDQYEGGWQDSNGDHVWDPDEPFVDENGNGKLDAVWIAGSQNARPATGVHDPITARILVIERGDLRVGIVVYDFIGWFIDEMEATRALIGPELGLDHVIFASIHSHQSPDTMGLWGRTSLESGVDLDYQQRVHRETAQGLAQAVAALEPVTMTVARTETVTSGRTSPYVADLRDPIIVDPTLTVIQFSSTTAPDRTVATLVHWAAHPEYVGFDNNLLSADLVHYIRQTVAQGAPASAAGAAAPGLGGTVIYLQGALGGQIGPWGTRPVAADGTEVTTEGWARAEAAGVNVGRLALEAITRSSAEDVASPRLGFRTGDLLVRVENTFYHVGALAGVFDRSLVGYDPERAIDETNIPFVRSRVTYLELGPVAMLTAPGELHPELFVGGYDGSSSYGVPIFSADNPNPPDLSRAPGPPYLRDVMRANPGVTYPLLLGLAEDTLGYIIPRWNFELDPGSPYLEEAEGDHYEETNSVGPTAEEEIVGPMGALVRWRP